MQQIGTNCLIYTINQIGNYARSDRFNTIFTFHVEVFPTTNYIYGLRNNFNYYKPIIKTNAKGASDVRYSTWKFVAKFDFLM